MEFARKPKSNIERLLENNPRLHSPMNPRRDVPLRVVFAGTPVFAAEILHGLIDAGFTIPAVLTQPDRPSGRGRKLKPSAVKQAAVSHAIPVLQPQKIVPAVIETVKRLNPDVVAVAAYGLILPADFLHMPALGCVNLHASILPRWRGAAPIQRAILAGDEVTGVSVMQMDEGLDTGAVLAQESCCITPRETAQTLHDKLAALGRDLFARSISALARGELPANVQDPALSTYAARLSKMEGLLDWNSSATELERRVRAFNPWPVAFCNLGEKTLRIWEARAIPECGDDQPGVVTGSSSNGVDIATGEGTLRLEKLQLSGGVPFAAIDFVNSGRLPPGTRLNG